MPRERAESQWADEHPDYDIESQDFPSQVFAMAEPIYMWDGGTLTLSNSKRKPLIARMLSRFSRAATGRHSPVMNGSKNPGTSSGRAGGDS